MKTLSKILLATVLVAASMSNAYAGCTKVRVYINGAWQDAWVCCNADGTRCWLWYQER
jgi:hypothetical protein